jgi:hypothetical protein
MEVVQMALQELIQFAKNRTQFDPEKRVTIQQLSKLLAKCSDDLTGDWHCIVVPQQEICKKLPPHPDLREDCEGLFTAVLITQPLSSCENRGLGKIQRRSLLRIVRSNLHSEEPLSNWLLRLIYTADGMDLLVKPLFHFDRTAIHQALQLSNRETVLLILLIGYPKESRQTCSPYVRFYTRHAP